MQPELKKTHDFLIKGKKTIAVAESCTGGLLSELLTRLPGSSRYFKLGVVAYSNEAKETILGVPKQIILKKGAVSKEVAKKMAQAARTTAKADFGIGVTGIAGPDGAIKGKPVGTVFIAVESKTKGICKESHFTGARDMVREKIALKAMELLKKCAHS